MDNYYFDRCLPMGCSSSCAIFEAFSTSLECLALYKFKASAVLHILDDFLFVASSLEKCHTDLANFLRLCDYLGVPIAHEKTVEPRTISEFPVITIDSIPQEARLPPDKLQKCRKLLHQFYRRPTVTLRELQYLIGLLKFACSVVVPGRAFLRRLIDLTIGITKAHHHIRLTRTARADIKLWLTFLDSFILMVGLFSHPIVGKFPPPYNTTPMRQGRRVMAQFLVLIGFMARGLDRGIPLMSLVSNSFQLYLQYISGGVL